MTSQGGRTEEEMEDNKQEQAQQGKAAKYPCIRCKKNVGKKGVRCNTCYLWVHVECGNISNELFAILAAPAKYGATGVTWNCDSCVASSARLEARMNALEGRFQEVENRMVRNEATMADVSKRMEDVERKQSTVEKALESERERIRRERANELRERDIRRKNVILHRVDEAGEQTTNEERKEWDLNSCDNIFQALNIAWRSRDLQESG